MSFPGNRWGGVGSCADEQPPWAPAGFASQWGGGGDEARLGGWASGHGRAGLGPPSTCGCKRFRCWHSRPFPCSSRSRHAVLSWQPKAAGPSWEPSNPSMYQSGDSLDGNHTLAPPRGHTGQLGAPNEITISDRGICCGAVMCVHICVGLCLFVFVCAY